MRVNDIADLKWKEMGKHISNIVTVNPDEKVVAGFIMSNSTKDKELITVTKDGMVKKTILALYNVTRYNKEICGIKLKDGDRVVNAFLDAEEMIIATKNGYSLRFRTEEIPLSGVKTGGVKGIGLKDDDEVIGSQGIRPNHEYLCVFTDNKTSKRIKLSDIEPSNRAKRGSMIIKKVKSTVYHLESALLCDAKTIFNLKYLDEVQELKASDIPIMDTSSTGSNVTKKEPLNVTVEPNLIIIEETQVDEDVALDREETNDDFLEEFRL